MILMLSWPSPDLSPNSRKHWIVKASAVKAYRLECWTLAKQAKVAPSERLSFIFRPPNGRHFDLDNLLARMKSGIDGLADAMKVNDRQFKLSIEMGAIQKPKGCVVVTL